MAPGTVNPQTKFAIGEIALRILGLELPAEVAMARLRDAAKGELENQYENRLSIALPRLAIVVDNTLAA